LTRNHGVATIQAPHGPLSRRPATTEKLAIRFMLQRLTVRCLLVCYGVIALWGQGLHEFLDGDDCDRPAEIDRSVIAAAPFGDATPCFDGAVGRLVSTTSIHAPNAKHEHDCDHCPICQFQALGQHFVAAPQVIVVLVGGGVLSSDSIAPVHSPALFSLAQPRAPPSAS
jgi:hypothetical protein